MAPDVGDMVEAPGTAPGSDGFIPIAIYRHSSCEHPEYRACAKALQRCSAQKSEVALAGVAHAAGRNENQLVDEWEARLALKAPERYALPVLEVELQMILFLDHRKNQVSSTCFFK